MQLEGFLDLYSALVDMYTEDNTGPNVDKGY